MKAKITVGEIVIDLEGTLTEVLCTLDAIDGDEPEEAKKTRKDWIRELSHAFLKNEYVDLFGCRTKVVSKSVDHLYNRYIYTFEFSDGGKLTLRDFT